jgi:uncharacterized protein YjiS (DUF1127 family)
MNALTHDVRSAAANAKAASALRAQERATFLGAALHALAIWWRSRREATRLSGYSDRMLKDIGMARGGIEWAVRHGRSDEDAGDPPADPIYSDEWSIQNEVHP